MNIEIEFTLQVTQIVNAILPAKKIINQPFLFQLPSN